MKNCSEKILKIHRKISLPESLFNKVVGLQRGTLLHKRPQHRRFPVNFPEFPEQFFSRTSR